MKKRVKEDEESHVDDEDGNDSDGPGNDPLDRRRVPGLIFTLAPGAKFFGLSLNISRQLREDDAITVTLLPVHVSDVNRSLRLFQRRRADRHVTQCFVRCHDLRRGADALAPVIIVLPCHRMKGKQEDWEWWRAG